LIASVFSDNEKAVKKTGQYNKENYKGKTCLKIISFDMGLMADNFIFLSPSCHLTYYFCNSW
jgi:hypothetical protein